MIYDNSMRLVVEMQMSSGGHDKVHLLAPQNRMQDSIQRENKLKGLYCKASLVLQQQGLSEI